MKQKSSSSGHTAKHCFSGIVLASLLLKTQKKSFIIKTNHTSRPLYNQFKILMLPLFVIVWTFADETQVLSSM